MTGPMSMPSRVLVADTKGGWRLRLQHGDKSWAGDSAARIARKFIPRIILWPIDDVWNYHAGVSALTTVNVFTDGLNRPLWTGVVTR